MKQAILLLCTLFLISCHAGTDETKIKNANLENSKSDKIKVLNFGTFHFGYTSDANKTDFDEEDENSQKEIIAISKMISQFRPTIICVEKLPEYNTQLNIVYQEFLKNPSELSAKEGEISMIAFDVARLSNVEKLYGIDIHMGYNYSVGDFVENSPEDENSIDAKTYLKSPTIHLKTILRLQNEKIYTMNFHCLNN